MRILVAEEDRISRTVLLRSLERLGYDCESAEDGQEALLKHAAGDFEMIISDWMMPALDGLELCRRVRQRGEAAGQGYTYFVLLTALESQDSFVAGMEAGADDYLTKPLDREQLRARLIAADRIMSLHRRLETQAAELEQLNQKLYDEGRIDSLTRVGNRLRMTEELTALHDRSTRYGHSCCIALCDIDFFKKYNDTCGHQAGDEALRAVAQCLDGQTRLGDAVYRYGGEEFLVLLPEQTLPRAAVAMERMRRAVEAMGIAHPGRDPRGVVTISGGVAHLGPGDLKSIEELLQQADAALYRSKESGRNRITLHETSG